MNQRDQRTDARNAVKAPASAGDSPSNEPRGTKKGGHIRLRKLGRALESKQLNRRPFDEYRRFMQRHYDGLPGALTRLTGMITGHESLARRLIGPRGFDVRGCKQILDAGCGNGRYTRFLFRHADLDARIVGFDYSQKMLERALRRVDSDRAAFLAADLTRLPFPNASFDAVVCGWVLEHLPDPLSGLRELARILRPGGKLLLLTTEDTLTGAVCSRLWHCRTYNRSELKEAGKACGLRWEREFWFTPLHRVSRLGGIIVQWIRAQE